MLEDLCMGSRPPKTGTSTRRPISHERLLQNMSDVISLREIVAQAEFAAGLYGLTLGQNGEEPKSNLASPLIDFAGIGTHQSVASNRLRSRIHVGHRCNGPAS